MPLLFSRNVGLEGRGRKACGKAYQAAESHKVQETGGSVLNINPVCQKFAVQTRAG